jgi:hypothetical protein
MKHVQQNTIVSLTRHKTKIYITFLIIVHNRDNVFDQWVNHVLQASNLKMSLPRLGAIPGTLASTTMTIMDRIP